MSCRLCLQPAGHACNRVGSMVKFTPKKKKRPHVAADLATAAGRKRARRELIWGDHGFLRARFSNLHQIAPDMWRANQPSPRQVVEHAKARGIKTIINLRGASTKGYYLLEKEACEAAGIALVDFQVFSRDTPTKEAIFGARDLFARIEYPALMHCKSGADRAGIMSVLYMLLHEKVPFAEARQQLSFKYLHIKHGKTGMLDAFFDAYERYNAGRAPEAWKPFLDWVEEDYDRMAVKTEFLENFGAKVQVDKILGRE
ncbi:fused DSP-PTPase phosphatase/NAD kinase-like protein [Hyphomonas oceanitis]|uniref:fused DSP-PTPase phosphatase/NAD kinase-like protein n=1 Tax=Hyphomonas oceanitis TaxID=81033 RepID=UPI003003044E